MKSNVEQVFRSHSPAEVTW